jgi:MFS transporter, DHA1 family, tetracycline resistance protein
MNGFPHAELDEARTISIQQHLMTDPTPQPGARRAAVVFIFVTVTLDMLAIGVIIPVLPKLVERFMGGDTASAAEMFGVFGTVWAVMQFFFSPILGSLSDKFGRRPVILLSNLGLGLDYIFMALAPTLGWLFVGRVISGITAASISTSFAYIADVTPPERRAAGFGMIGMAFGFGFVVGPAMGGLLGGIEPRLPFWVAAALSLANALYGWLILPESLAPERRAPFSWRRANPVGSLNLLRSQPALLGLALVNFLGQLAHVVLPAVSVLYTGYRYGWDEQTIGLMLAGVGVCSAIVQGALVGRTVARFGERRALLAGLIFGAVGFAMIGLAPTGTIYLASIPLMALWGLASPAVQGLMTRRVDASAQGRLQGANGSLTGIAGLIGPGLFSVTFASFIGREAFAEIPGAPFLLASLLLIVALVLAWRLATPPENQGA